MELLVDYPEDYGPIPGLPVRIIYKREHETHVENLTEGKVVSFRQRNSPTKDGGYISPSLLRDAFIQMKTPEEGAEILASCGPWYPPKKKFDIQVIKWDELVRWRDGFMAEILGKRRPIDTSRMLMISEVREPRVGQMYGEVRFAGTLDERGRPRHQDIFFMDCECALEAMSALIETEKRSRIRYKRCERENCPRKLFRIGAKESKKYCSKKCQKAEEQRRVRERRATASHKKSAKRSGGSSRPAQKRHF